MLPFAIVMTVFSTVLSCVMLAVTLTRKSIFMMKSHPTETITQSAMTMTTYSAIQTGISQEIPDFMTASSNFSSLATMKVRMVPSAAAITVAISPSPSPTVPILSSFSPASALTDHNHGNV
ncbi:hypothetical protein V8C35DRAFT_288785 [Trichoderma chlorosporum]